MTQIRILILLGCGIAAALPALAKTVTMAEFMQGNAAPDEIHLKDLDAGWSKLNVDTTVTQPMSMFLAFAASSMGAEIPSSTMYYTRGDKITLGDVQFLIAYQKPNDVLSADEIDTLVKADIPDTSTIREMANRLSNPTYHELTGDTAFTLTLINLRTVGSLSAFKVFDLAAELPTPAQKSQLLHLQSQRYLHAVAEAMLKAAQGPEGKLPQNLDDLGEIPQILRAHGLQNDYSMNESLAGTALKAMKQPAETVLVYEQHPKEDGLRGVAFADGHVAMLNEKEWAECAQKSGIK